jgi:glutamate synthase (NADPH/NADH) small chain
VRVLSENGQVKGLTFVRTELGPADASGRRAPRPIEGSDFTICADQVVKAVGQEKPGLADKLGLATEKGFIKVNAEFETSIPGVFAGGDCIRAKNAASTVMAVEDGKLAAMAIHQRMMSDGEVKARG